MTANILVIFVHTATTALDWISRKPAWQKSLGESGPAPISVSLGLLAVIPHHAPGHRRVSLQRFNGNRKKKIKRERGCVSTGLHANIAEQTGVLGTGLLPFLRGCHQRRHLVIMVFPHGEAVQRLISTLRERHIQHLGHCCACDETLDCMIGIAASLKTEISDTHTHKCIDMHKGQEWK